MIQDIGEVDLLQMLERNISSEYIVDIIDLPDGKDPGSLTDEEIERLYKFLYE